MSHAIDLKPEYLEIVKAILTQHLPSTAKVWLFGSRARGASKKFSDIDLLIDLGKPISIETLSALNLAFEESNLPYKVDLADARSINNLFHKNIQSQLIQLT